MRYILFWNQDRNIQKIWSFIYFLFLNTSRKISTLKQKYRIIGTYLQLGLLELDGHEQKQKPFFCDNWKPAMLEIGKPLTSDLIGMCFHNPVFPNTTYTPIYLFKLKTIYINPLKGNQMCSCKKKSYGAFTTNLINQILNIYPFFWPYRHLDTI